MRRKKPTLAVKFFLVIDMLNNGMTLAEACSRVGIERIELFRFADYHKELMKELDHAIENSGKKKIDHDAARRKTREHRKAAGMILRD